MAKRIVLSPEEKELIAQYAKREISATELCITLQQYGLTVVRITGNAVSLSNDDVTRHVEF